jgi:PRC-barrel domain protein
MKNSANLGESGTAIEETQRLIASDKVEGTAVFDAKGRHLGRIHHLMIDKYSGQVVYAVASFGGFFGLGDSRIPLPWRALKYDPRVAGYVVDADRDKLEQAPRCDTSEPDWPDRAFDQEIEQYWYPPL